MLKADIAQELTKIADDEPVFLLRAQDRFMPEIIRMWVRAVRSNYERPTKGDKFPMMTPVQYQKLKDAIGVADAAEAWQIGPFDEEGNPKNPNRGKVPT